MSEKELIALLWGDEAGRVGDGVAHAEAAARPALEVQGLVQVSTPGRVDGDERQVTGIDAVGLVHAAILRLQALLLPVRTLVLGGGH